MVLLSDVVYYTLLHSQKLAMLFRSMPRASRDEFQARLTRAGAQAL